MINLGDKVKHTITGVEGVVVARVQYLDSRGDRMTKVYQETTIPPAASKPEANKSQSEMAWDACVVKVEAVKLTADVMAACAKAVGKTDGSVGESLEAAFASARDAHATATSEEHRAFLRYQTVLGQGDLCGQGGSRTVGRDTNQSMVEYRDATGRANREWFEEARLEVVETNSRVRDGR